MQYDGVNMSGAGKIVVSAAIGGTTEALGGGKFANGAVTGAYVMMLNHLGEHAQEKRDSKGKHFYTKDGKLITRTSYGNGKDQVIVIPDEYINDFIKAAEFTENYGNTYDLDAVIKHGIEYNYSIVGDDLNVREKFSLSTSFKMAVHFAGEGAFAGYASQQFSKDNRGLQYHYQSSFTAHDYWLPRVSVKSFEPWWK